MSKNISASLIEPLEAQTFHASAVLHALAARLGALFRKFQPLRLKLRRHKGAEVLQDGFGIEREGWHLEIYTPGSRNGKLGKQV